MANNIEDRNLRPKAKITTPKPIKEKDNGKKNNSSRKP